MKKKEMCLTLIVFLIAGTCTVYAENLLGPPTEQKAPVSDIAIQETTASAIDTSAKETTAPAIDTSTKETTAPAIDTSTKETTAPAIDTSTKETTAPAITLSLKDAVKIMQTTGTRAETAELNKKSDTSLARGYGEKVKTIAKVLDGLDLLDKYSSMGYVSSSTAFDKSIEAQDKGATSINKRVSELRRDFAKEQIEKNYKAEMNQIEYDTLKVYYGVLLASDNLKTEQDNLQTQKDILKNTKAQYQAGMLAKKDVLSAESAVTTAESSVKAAETKLEYARMSFNYLLGYSATQKVKFTDKLEVVSAPAIDVEASVKNALKNRNEIKGAQFAVEVHQVLLDNLMGYPRSSSTYMNEKIALMAAQKTEKDAPVLIEIEIRNKASELEDKAAALEAAKSVQAYAQEGYRLINISYKAGMTALAELQQAQLNVYKAGLAVSAATSDYDLAVYDFQYTQDVGTKRLSL